MTVLVQAVLKNGNMKTYTLLDRLSICAATLHTSESSSVT